MPALAFLAVVSLVLIAMLFVADATLENVSPPIVTSNRIGLPEPWHPESTDPDLIRNLPTAPAPAPDMASDLVRDTMPKAQSAPEENLANVKPAARAARAGGATHEEARHPHAARVSTEQHLVALLGGPRVWPVRLRPLLNRTAKIIYVRFGS